MRAISHLPLALLLLYFGVVFHGVLFSTEGAFERDAFYHARYAQMLPERGLSRQFPWMQFTAWKDKFADKDFLYHVILAPFCRDSAEPLPGAKWATLLLSLSGLGLFYFLLVRLRVPWPLFWVALLAVGSGAFLDRMLMVRSHVLSVLLMILAAYAIVKERAKSAFAIGFVYAWSYSFPLAMLISALAGALGIFLNGERSWRATRVPLFAGAGIAAGLIIHPYSPNSLSTIWALLNISASRASGVKLELGSEFAPVATLQAFSSIEAFGEMLLALAVSYPGPLLALAAAAVLAILLKRKRPDTRKLSNEAAAALCIGAVWFSGLFIFSRLVEYFAPTAALAGALVVRDAFAPNGSASPTARPWVAGYLAATLAIAGFHYISVEQIAFPLVNSTRNLFEIGHDPLANFKSWHRNRFFDGATAWMRQNIKPGETVINFHWDDFTELYYGDTDQNYLVGLDPTLMRLEYPQHSATLESMRTKKVPLNFDKLKEFFGSDYVVMRRYRAAEYPELKSNAYTPIFADDHAVIYKISAQPGAVH